MDSAMIPVKPPRFFSLIGSGIFPFSILLVQFLLRLFPIQSFVLSALQRGKRLHRLFCIVTIFESFQQFHVRRAN